MTKHRRPSFHLSRLAVGLLLACGWAASAAAAELAPFGSDSAIPPAPITVQNKKGYGADIPCTGATHAAGWAPAGIQRRNGSTLCTLAPVAGREALNLATDDFEPGQTILSFTLPDDGNGDLWEAQGATWVSFLCRSAGGPVQMALSLTTEGKDPGPGNPAAPFIVPGAAEAGAADGGWQRVVLPLAQFGLKNFHHVARIGLGVAKTPAGATTVSFTGFSVGTHPYTDASFAKRAVSVSLKGGWRFAPDPSGDGLARHWQDAAFDDAAWTTVEAGKSLKEQGVAAGGWVWFRQRLALPATCAGQPLVLNLAKIPYDDEVYVNGTRVGGTQGGYKYEAHDDRQYVVPAALVRSGPGQANTIAIRVWTVDGIGLYGDASGLIAGTWTAEVDPFRVAMRPAGGTAAQELPAEAFDLTAAQQGLPCEAVVRLPAELFKDGSRLQYTLLDWYGGLVQAGTVPLGGAADGVVRGVIPLPAEAARTLYFRGRFKLGLVASDPTGVPLYGELKEVDRISLAARDTLRLPELPATTQDTPCGRLALIDEIDCATPLEHEAHPYMQSGFDHRQDRQAPGPEVAVAVHDILGRPAREGAYGWFAYRVGRGTLVPHQPYLLRIEYPEDKPRYGALTVEAGLDYMGIGWKNGVSADDPYDNWPLSQAWRWYDVVVVAGDQTTGSAGAMSAPGDRGFWVYLQNKLKPQRYFDQYQGGPAVARIQLFALDATRDAPVVRAPAGLPQRTLMVDWERQAMQDPADLVRYCRLMGYDTVAPTILKWGSAMWGAPLSGYDSYNVDTHGYWVRRNQERRGGAVASALPGRATVHDAYLDATRGSGVRYMPRIEYGGSNDLPVEARAVGGDGEKALPNRFAQWSADLLHPATWDDLARLVEHLFRAQAAGNPQLAGMLWRIRCDRMQISFGRGDVELFAKDTGAVLPALGNKDLADWASSGEAAGRYRVWWLAKRAAFHLKLRDLLRSCRSDLELTYFNWDSDKWWLGIPDRNSAAAFAEVAKSRAGMVPSAYANDLALRRKFSGEDYVRMIRSGQLGERFGWGVDYALDTDLYRAAPGMQLFAPVDYLYLADNPAYLAYFTTAAGLAVSNAVSYDELGMRSINPKFEGNLVNPGGPEFAMALEVLAWFHGDVRTLTYTTYTYGRGFAAAHRRFAQAFRALPAIPGTVVPGTDPAVKARTYATSAGTYLGLAHRGYAPKEVTISVPGTWAAGTIVTDLVSGQPLAATIAAGALTITIQTGAMELDAYLIK